MAMIDIKPNLFMYNVGSCQRTDMAPNQLIDSILSFSRNHKFPHSEIRKIISKLCIEEDIRSRYFLIHEGSIHESFFSSNTQDLVFSSKLYSSTYLNETFSAIF